MRGWGPTGAQAAWENGESAASQQGRSSRRALPPRQRPPILNTFPTFPAYLWLCFSVLWGFLFRLQPATSAAHSSPRPSLRRFQACPVVSLPRRSSRPGGSTGATARVAARCKQRGAWRGVAPSRPALRALLIIITVSLERRLDCFCRRRAGRLRLRGHRQAARRPASQAGRQPVRAWSCVGPCWNC